MTMSRDPRRAPERPEAPRRRHSPAVAPGSSSTYDRASRCGGRLALVCLASVAGACTPPPDAASEESAVQSSERALTVPGHGSLVLMRDTDTNEMVEMPLIGHGPAFAYVPSSSVPEWHVIGSGDFNNDGEGDLLWQRSDGAVAYWIMQNGERSSFSDVLGFAPRSPQGFLYSPIVADIDQDGLSDILWVGFVVQQVPPPPPFPPPLPAQWGYKLWHMNGATITETSGTTVGKIVGGGQFDGTGALDYLTVGHDPASRFVNTVRPKFLLASGIVTNGPEVDGSSEQVKVVGDFDGDGTTDVVWQTTDGRVDMWKIVNGAIAWSFSPATVPPSAWTLLGAGDFDGDGVSDLYWQTTDAQTGGIWSFDRTFAVRNWGDGGFHVAPARAFVGIADSPHLWGEATIYTRTYAADASAVCPTFTMTVTRPNGVTEAAPISPADAHPRKDMSGYFVCESIIDRYLVAQQGAYVYRTSLGGAFTARIFPNQANSYVFCPLASGCPKPTPTPPPQPKTFTNYGLNLSFNTPGSADGQPLTFSNSIPMHAGIDCPVAPVANCAGTITSFGTDIGTTVNFPYGENPMNCINGPFLTAPRGYTFTTTDMTNVFGSATPRFPRLIVACQNTQTAGTVGGHVDFVRVLVSGVRD
jgi:hypothetical protein